MLLAVIFTALGVFARFYLLDFLGKGAPLVLFYISISAVAWYGGLIPGLFATVLAAVCGVYFFINPGSLYLPLFEDQVRILIFVLVGTFISFVCESLINAKEKIEIERLKLEEEVKERIEAEAALKDANRRKDEFLAILAHELRNPLAPIQNSLNIIDLTNDPAIVRHAYGTINRQTRQLIQLVDDLLDVSRITQGKIELRKSPVKLSDILTNAVEVAEPLITAKKHKLVVNQPDQTVWLDADAIRLAQVVSNILVNAAKYTDNNGSIILNAAIDGDDVEIEIIDNGIGIPGDKLDYIFDLFAQVDSSVERSEGGLGIGLTLVKKLVDLHGGSVTAASSGKEGGSVFTIRLPRMTSGTENLEAIPYPIMAAQKPQFRVLVVDDNEPSAKTLGWMVELLGYECHISTEGREAIKLAAEYKPDVVLLDIGMPGLSGYDICREMKTNPDLASTLFIAQTGWGQEKDRQLSAEAGFHHHLVKPIELDKLKELFKTIETK